MNDQLLVTNLQSLKKTEAEIRLFNDDNCVLQKTAAVTFGVHCGVS